MTHRLPLLLSGRGRLFIICILLLLAIGNGYGQTGCSCPAVASCSPCAGGLTNLVLDYTGGGIIVTVTATDGDGLLSASLLSSTITITKTPANTPFNGSVTVTVVGVGITGGNQVIVTSCAVPVQQGSVFGNFKVVSGASLGGPLCCATTNQDQTAPAFSTLCPANIQRFVSAGSCSATATWAPPVATDNCGSAVTLTSTHNPGDTFPLGITTVTYTAKDIYNNSATCSFNVEVIDNILPAIACPSGFDVYVVGSCRFIVPDYTSLANATDNCTTVTVSQSPAIGTVLTNVGTVQAITLTATDGSGNTKNCSFNITLKDNIAPVITCPSNFNVFSNASCQFVIPSYISLATTNDNCGATVTQSPAIGTIISGVGTTQLITLTAKDGTGNTTTCSFTITIKDNTPPVITCPANFDVFTNTNCQFILPNYTGLGSATDNCDTNVTITQSPAIGTVISGASRVITLTATDDSNNISTCTFTITLKDNIAPVIANCPSNISITTNTSSCNATATWTAPTATDKCALSSLTSTHNPGSLFPLGITTVTYKATDVAGNSATCSFTVEVKDNVNPIITNCPSDITVSAGPGCRAIVSWTAPTATDNCSIASLTSNRNSGSLFVSGTTLVTYTAIDGSGNRSTCSFNVIVRDLTAPVFSGCPSTITINSEADCKTTVAWTAPTAADDCSTATVTSTHHTGDEFDTGTTSVTYTARDAAGNTSTCSFNVVVIDKVAPQITCVANLTVASGNTCGANVSWTTPLVTDCSAVTLTSVPAMGSFFAVGTTNVTYTAADASGNSSTCTFKVTVEDKTRPVFTNCITEIKAVTDQSCKAIVSWTAPTATDNCSTPSVIASHSPGSEFPIGTTQVTYTATDAAGNTSQCQFAIIITDGNVPVITNCPGDQSLQANESGQVTATWTEPTTSVACGTATLTSSRKPGELFAVGANEVTYTSTSNSGIHSTCTFFINVAYEELMYEVSKLITPNGDGINDLWELKNIELFKDNKVTVVDRWGGVIYTAHGYNNTSVSWNGTNTNGAMVPTGTYFYTISVKFRDTTVDKKGFIELLR